LTDILVDPPESLWFIVRFLELIAYYTTIVAVAVGILFVYISWRHDQHD
jgi:hypothetical protein